MGAEKDTGKNEGEKKADAGKKDDGPAPIVLKLDMHCEGCAKKVKKFIRNIDGVENVKADIATNKLTVNGKVDPAQLRDRIAVKTNKKVELISPQPKKDGGGDKKADDKSEKKADDKKAGDKKADDKKADDKKPKEPPVSTIVLKIRLHCDGCINKIRKIIGKYKGVKTVDVDRSKDLITVIGTMDAKELVAYLTEKLKRSVELVPAKKDEAGGDKKGKEAGGGGGEKKDKEAAGGGGGGEKKEKEKEKEAGGGGGGDGGVKVEANKMEYYGTYGYQAAPPSFWYDDPGHAYGHAYMMGGPSQIPTQQIPNHQGYVVEHYPMPAYDAHAPQIFSDENPNACSVM